MSPIGAGLLGKTVGDVAEVWRCSRGKSTCRYFEI